MNTRKMLFAIALLFGMSTTVFAISGSGDISTTGGSLSSGEDFTPTTSTASPTSAIVIDPITKKIYVTTGYFQNTGLQSTTTIPTVSTGSTTPNFTGTSTPSVSTGTTTPITNTGSTTSIIEPITNPQMTEFEQALAWMYANGLTKYSDPKEYRPQDFLTREESAKILGQLYAILGYNQTAKNTTSCEFLDADTFDPSLVTHIKNVCARSLFKGYQGNYMPTQPLTKPQTMSVLMRMFEQKMSNETKTPRWGDYYLKGETIGLITQDAMSNYDTNITREQVALYAFRLKNIVLNEKQKIMSLNAIAKIDLDQNNPTATNTADAPQVISQNLGTLANNISAGNDPELQEAVQRMYDNGLTMYLSVEEYSPFVTLTREGGAKILNVFAGLFNLAEGYSGFIPANCVFTDIGHMDATMKNHIQSVCGLGLLRGDAGSFNPGDQLTKAEFVVALMRMFEGKHLDETTSPRRKNYFEKAQELGIVGPADVITFEGPITRYEVALFLYRFKVKYQMLKNLNSSKLQNEVISTVEGSIITGTNGYLEANVYVDSNLIKNTDFNIGYVEIFEDRYKLVKTATEKYDLPESFVRYGDLFDIVENTKIGTISIIVSNGAVIESTIRLSSSNKRFSIQSLSDTKAYFKIREIVN